MFKREWIRPICLILAVMPIVGICVSCKPKDNDTPTDPTVLPTETATPTEAPTEEDGPVLSKILIFDLPDGWIIHEEDDRRINILPEKYLDAYFKDPETNEPRGDFSVRAIHKADDDFDIKAYGEHQSTNMDGTLVSSDIKQRGHL